MCDCRASKAREWSEKQVKVSAWFFAGIVQRLVRQPSKLDMRVRFPLPALGQRANEYHKNRCSRWVAGIQGTKYDETDCHAGVFAALFV